MRVDVDTSLSYNELYEYLKDRNQHHSVSIVIFKEKDYKKSIPYLSVVFKNITLKNDKRVCTPDTAFYATKKCLKLMEFVRFPKNVDLETKCKMSLNAYKKALITLETNPKYDIHKLR